MTYDVRTTAFVLRSYGSADRLQLVDLAKPTPQGDEVLVRVRATSVNPYDWHLMRGEPYVARLLPGGLGLRRPTIDILGCDMAGTVEAVGPKVTRLRPGDDVFALLTGGGFGQYTCVSEGLLAPKPKNLSHAETAAVPMAAVTALVALCAEGRLAAGQKVLVNGASGGVGTFAVQLARAFGAKVVAVCGPRNAELVRSIGADEVIDYRAEDFTRSGRRYDLLLDIAGGRSAAACRRVVTPKGTIVAIGGQPGRWVEPAGHVLATLAAGPLVSQRVRQADAVRCPDKRERLTELAALIEDGRVRPVIDREYPFAKLPEAVRYQEAGHAAGKVVVTMEA